MPPASELSDQEDEEAKSPGIATFCFAPVRATHGSLGSLGSLAGHSGMKELRVRTPSGLPE